MPEITQNDACNRLADVVEKAEPIDLAEYYAEIFPDKRGTPPPPAIELAKYVRAELAPEEIVDLWNVVFPADFNVWYNEEDDVIEYNEEVFYDYPRIS